MYLSNIKPQTQVKIIKFWNNLVQNRLTDLGFFIGDKIQIDKYAPLGDPIIVSSQYNTIQINKSEAKTIEVEYC